MQKQLFAEIDILKNSANFTEKDQYRSPFFNKVYQKDTPTQVFFCEICKVF